MSTNADDARAQFHREVQASLQQDPNFKAILDRCPYCQLPVQPGEVHGEVIPAGSVPLDLNNYAGIMRTPQIRCRIKKLAYVEDVIETPAPDPA